MAKLAAKLTSQLTAQRSLGWLPPGWLGGSCIVAAIALFTWLPLSYYRMVAWPWIGVWQAGFLAAGLALIVWLRRFEQPVVGLGHGFDSWAIAAAAGVGLAALAAPFPTVALTQWLLVLGYGIWLYLAHQLLQRPCAATAAQLRQALWTGAVALAAIAALISLSLWRPEAAMWSSGDFYRALRNPQPLGHHNFVGGYFALMLPLTLAWAISQSGRGRWLGWGASAVVAVALYVSGSRGAALGCLGWAVVAVGGAIYAGPSSGRWRRLLLGSLVLLVLLAGLLSNPRVRTWFEGVQWRPAQPGAVAIADSPTLDRLFMVQLGRNIFRDRPWLGVGPGNMGRVSNLYRPIETGEGLDHIQQLHNTPVQLMGELGLVGLGLYLAWWSLIGRLWWRLHRSLPATARADRALLYGSGGSLLAYGLASLTDYQLENIAISSMLGLNLLLLLLLAASAPRPLPLPESWRRLASLALLAVLGLMVASWLPFDLSLALGQSGDSAAAQGNLAVADNRWFKASALAPWDPTFSALASEKLLPVVAALKTEVDPQGIANRQALEQSLLDYATQAQQAAPNDVWFNQNLAVLYQSSNLAQAERYAARAAQLLPRNQNFTYCLLGQIYAAQNKREQAIAAFTLEALVRPDFLTYPLWASPPLQALYSAVSQQTLAAYQNLLADLSPQSPQYPQVYGQWAMLQWWTGERWPDAATPELAQLRPLLRALLLAEQQPEAALAVVNAAIAQGDPDPSLPLLAAWLQPDPYLASYLEHAPNPAEAALIADSMARSPDLRRWLTSLIEAVPQRYRGSLAFAYRNQAANALTLMLRPEAMETYTLVQKLALLPSWPREFAALDRQIEQYREQQLGLPHPSHNRFQLTQAAGPAAQSGTGSGAGRSLHFTQAHFSLAFTLAGAALSL